MARDAAALQNQVWALANMCYTPENIERANQYLRTRGIDPAHLQYPYTFTGPVPDRNLAPYIRPERVTNTLLIPVVSIANPQKLIAFDVRYLGQDPMIPRYSKIKGSPPEPMIYGIHRALAAPKGTPIILGEGAIDCEAAYQMTGLPAVGYLTALAAPSVVATLAAITDLMLIALDNDADGIEASNKLFDIAQRSREAARLFVMVNYHGKDPGKAAETEQGRKVFLEATQQAIELAKARPPVEDKTVFAEMAARVTPTEMVIPQKVVNPFA